MFGEALLIQGQEFRLAQVYDIIINSTHSTHGVECTLLMSAAFFPPQMSMQIGSEPTSAQAHECIPQSSRSAGTLAVTSLS